MKSLISACCFSIALAATCLGGIGDDEKKIEARYGKPGKDMGTHGEVHSVGYSAGGFLIVVDFVNGISQREGFANPDTSPLTPEAIQQILYVSGTEGTKWDEKPGEGGDKTWSRSDNKVIAILPAMGKLLFVQDVNFVQPKQ